MPVKKSTTRTKKKHTVAKLPVRVLTKKINPLRQLADGEEEISPEDLLPESREFLDSQETEDIVPQNIVRINEDPAVLAKEEKYKSMIMWTGISFFMVLILIVWGFNMKKVFKQNAIKAKDNQTASQSWDDFSKELSKVMSALDEQTKELKDAATTTQNVLPAEETGFTVAGINELKNKLESATSTATTTPITTKKLKK